MAGGIYNETYFRNYPEEKERDGILYGIVLVNMKTWERETIKVGIAKGRTFKDAFIIADEMQNATDSQMKMLQYDIVRVYLNLRSN